MLNIDRLLKLASGAQVEPDPTDPTRPDHEKRKSGQQNLGETRANPTDPTDPTEKTAVATKQDAGAERPCPWNRYRAATGWTRWIMAFCPHTRPCWTAKSAGDARKPANGAGRSWRIWKPACLGRKGARHDGMVRVLRKVLSAAVRLAETLPRLLRASARQRGRGRMDASY